jgi:membrane-bound inhibitor of C-type lysozyme
MLKSQPLSALALLAALAALTANTAGCSWPRPAERTTAEPAKPDVVATSPGGAGQPHRQSTRLLAEGWRCEDGRTAGTRYFAEAKATELRVDGRRVLLPQHASASGARFEDAEWLFWNRGAQAMLQRKPSPPVYCTEVRALSLIEDARARGITFRGQGNEPGWLLEIGPGDRVLLVESFGTRRSTWANLPAAPGPVTGSSRRVAESDGRRYTITVLPDDCVDDMSGDRFTSTVMLEIDGRRLRGCGNAIGD